MDGVSIQKYLAMSIGEKIFISIHDTGIGIPTDLRDKIFEPFFTTKDKEKGTGLGLSTVYGIVKQHNGYIYVYSEPGSGTTFKIYLPVAAHEDVQTDKREARHKPGGTETMLIVEDEPSIRELVVKVLQPLGYKLLTAANGKEALQISADFAGDIPLILTDVIMPGLNGRELAESIEKERPDTKVIFMSGYTDDVISSYGVLDPGVNFIQKPLAPITLAI
ncbi:MAG: response regulator, partial [Calditrichia bacterium]|nr:response regulator [Calditrichia bacterium]